MKAMNKMTRVFGGLIMSICLVIVSGTALAKSVPFVVDCSFGSDLLPAIGGGDLTTSTDCENFNGGGSLGNDTQANITAFDPFGITDWTLAAKSDGSDGDGVISLLSVVNGGSSGIWSLGPGGFNGYTDVFLTLKSANGFAAYLLDPDFTSGEWTTLFGLDGKGLSHMSLYYSPTPFNSPTSVVPVPAAFWLFGTALVGLVGFGKRRKTR